MARSIHTAKGTRTPLDLGSLTESMQLTEPMGVRAPLNSLTKPEKRKGTKTAFKRTQLAPDALKPNLDNLIARNGAKPTALALSAWDARLRDAHSGCRSPIGSQY
jgi:hypothetical protein